MVEKYFHWLPALMAAFIHFFQNSFDSCLLKDLLPLSCRVLNGPNKLYCDNLNRLWVSYYGGIAVHSNSAWEMYDSSQLAVGPESSQVITDITGDKNGIIWVSTLYSLASYAEGEWAVFQDGYGFTGDYLFSSLAVSQEGIPWAGYASGLLALDGMVWRNAPYSQLGPVNDLLIRLAVKPGQRRITACAFMKMVCGQLSIDPTAISQAITSTR